MSWISIRLRANVSLKRVALALLLVSASQAKGTVDAGGAPDSKANNDIVGRWTITGVLDAADIAAMSDRQAWRLVGKEVIIDERKFVFNGRTCKKPTYERSVDELTRSFREQGHVSPAKLGLPDPVTSIDARCTHLYLKKPGRIVIHWDGFYFDARRRPHSAPMADAPATGAGRHRPHQEVWIKDRAGSAR